MESYFDELNSDLITEIVRYLDYDNLHLIVTNNIINNKHINYSKLFYDLDEELVGKQINIGKSNYECMSNMITYPGLKSIIKDSPIVKFCQDPYEILYIMLLREDSNLSDLINMRTISLNDNKLYHIIMDNKTFIDYFEFKYFDKIVKIPYIQLNELLHIVSKDNVIPDTHFKPFLDDYEPNNYVFLIDIGDIIQLYYLDNIKEILHYLNSEYGLKRTGSDFYSSLDIFEEIKYKEKQYEFIDHLIKVYPDIINLQDEHTLVTHFARIGRIDLAVKIFEAAIKSKKNFSDLTYYIDMLLDEINDIIKPQEYPKLSKCSNGSSDEELSEESESEHEDNRNNENIENDKDIINLSKLHDILSSAAADITEHIKLHFITQFNKSLQ